MIDRSPILLLVTDDDLNYLPTFKPLLGGRASFYINATPDSCAEIAHYCASAKIKYVICTNSAVLNLVVEAPKKQNLKDWAGSLYERMGITFLFLQPLAQFYTVPYGSFIAKRFVSKICAPHEWTLTPEFAYEVASPANIDQWYGLFEKCLAIAVDIETHSFEDPKTRQMADPQLLTRIRCICFTGLWEDGNIYTLVFPISEAKGWELQIYWLTWMRKFLSLKVPKIFQNGLYDNAHLLTYNAPGWGYLFDTQSLFHCWYSELPKRLDFISAFLIHNVFYWKDMGQDGRLEKLYEYNARDGWATMVSFLALLKDMPDYAINNYFIKFPLWVPCLTCNLDGLRINNETRAKLIGIYKHNIETIRARLGRWFGEGFNPNSPPQVIKLLSFYGSPDLTSSDEPSMEKFALRHPLNARFAGEIREFRESAKIISTYLKPSDYSVAVTKTKKKTYLLSHGRLFYSHNPDGTDTGRLACREGYDWTGAQIQNFTPLVKEMVEADPGFELFEADLQKADAWGVAYLSGDKNLIDAVNSTKDFHAINATRFFGVTYESIIDETNDNEVLDIPIRNLSKRTNHGSGYNMGAAQLLRTMGEKAIDRAKELLGLPRFWNRIRVCEYLLECYVKAYPGVKTDYYQWVTNTVEFTHKLISSLGWTRYCFGHPKKNKRDLNALVAHGPQNLTTGVINEGFKAVYWKCQRLFPNLLRLKGQIHDSIFGQVRIGHRDLLQQVLKCCTITIEVTDCKGVKRSLTMPITIKVGPNWDSMKKWKPNTVPTLAAKQ